MKTLESNPMETVVENLAKTRIQTKKRYLKGLKLGEENAGNGFTESNGSISLEEESQKIH